QPRIARLEQREPVSRAQRALDRRERDFAIPLRIVRIGGVEQRAVDLDREIQLRAHPEVVDVEIAAVLARRHRIGLLLRIGRDAPMACASFSTWSASTPCWAKNFTGSLPWSSRMPSCDTVSKITTLPEGTDSTGFAAAFGRLPQRAVCGVVGT